MQYDFIKTNPSQNMTILVESAVPRAEHKQVATSLMAYESVYAEQVGFMEPATLPGAWARLQMAGGEFCGNASLSAAAVLAWKRKLPLGERQSIPLETSGADEVLSCEVTVHEGSFYVSMDIPSPASVSAATLQLDNVDYAATIVRLQGITHMVLDAASIAEELSTFAPRAMAAWSPRWDDDACGLILYCKETQSSTPLVYVKSISSLVWERGCGSGTAAIGAHLARLANGAVSADISQPGGIISVRAMWSENRISSLSIATDVRIAAHGTAYL